MEKKKELTTTLENYLKSIGEIISEKQVARAKDIAEKLGVTLSTVTLTLKILHEKGFIDYKPYHYVTLTSKGENLAKQLMKKERVLVSFLEEVLDISESDAEKIACEMEHSVSDDNLEKFQQFLVFLDNCPLGGTEFKRRFEEFKVSDKDYLKNCEECISSCLENYLSENNNGIYLENSVTTLDKIPIGEKAEIQKIRRNPLLARRFCEMGGISGTIVRVEKVAPLGDPISIKIKGSEISIRKEEAQNIIVKKV